MENAMIASNSVLPWHDTYWAMMESAMARDQMHHALLLHGLSGLGKLRFAQSLAALMLCESETDAVQRPCGQCRGCQLNKAGSHPDKLSLMPEDGKTQISVDQVRALISENVLTSHYGGYRVIVLSPAHSMSANAANALLKTLEEPPLKHVFILVSDSPNQMPVTLRSRCVSLLFGPPQSQQAKSWLSDKSSSEVDWDFWLKWTGGAPLAALEAANNTDIKAIQANFRGICELVQGRADPVAMAQQWRSNGLSESLDWQLRLLGQLMQQCTTQNSWASVPDISEIASHLNWSGMNLIYDELMELRDAEARSLHPNDRLSLESLAVTWQLASSR
jgi:DNA polymerase-3 subunit delta'